MKRHGLRRFTVWLLILTTGFMCLSGNINAFDGPTHWYVTKTSLAILCGIDRKYFDFYNKKSQESLLVYCVKPDEDEAEGGYKNHFYNPLTEKNFMGERQSALTKFTSHYENAAKNYKAGRMDLCWEELGRAIHFVEDLSTPVHTNYEDFWDAGLRLFMHVEFEKKCVEVQSKCIAMVEPESLNYYLDNSNETIGTASAGLSSDIFFDIYKKHSSEISVAKNTVSNAQKTVTGVLYKFYTEMTSSNK